ncbi:DUF1236 domain-containing protein [Chelativorans sp.]|uniref:DUF1236 domain-containing protein n=1 Tax=Chelativorans sp. TaxID=2203393 RepID=UPI002810C06A|nr:DUF1236 domain-containing protein [Chelativorans sp.]
MKALKISGLAAALLSGAAMTALPAFAQGSGTAPTQQRILPQQGGDQSGGSADTQDTQTQDSTGGTTRQDADTGQAEAESTPDAGQPSEQSASDEAPGQKAQSGEAESASEAAPGQMQKSGEVESATEAAPGQMKQEEEASTQEPSNETTAAINISDEQKTEIRNIIVESDVEPVDIDVEVEIGVNVPDTIELRPLPPRIVELVPAYEGYMFFVLADGRIIIVEPDTHEVVYIIVA